MTFSDVMTLISNWAIPLVVALVCFWAILKKVPVYSIFTEGAKEGFSTAVMIIPYLTAMLCAIGMFRASGAMDWLCAILDPVTSLIGCPSEILPQAIMRSFSGGASEGMLADLLATYGTQSKIASVAQGSTETTFYIIAVYMGSVGVSNARHSVAAGLLGDLGSLLAAVAIVNIMWF